MGRGSRRRKGGGRGERLGEGRVGKEKVLSKREEGRGRASGD